MAVAFKVLFLAVLQGVAEFLPISSSGHLALAGRLLNFEGMGVRVEIILHLGTLAALIAYYRQTLLALAREALVGSREGWTAIGLLVVGCLPAGLAYVLFDDAIEAAFEGSAMAIGVFLMVTGLLLLSLRLRKGDGDGKITWGRALAIGAAQAFALLPGISRSGSTIVCARHLGVSPKNAADYSFLVSLPLLLGATLLSFVHPAEPAIGEPGWGLLIPAACVSAVVGYFSIRLLMRVLAGPKFWYFGFYCLAAGLLTVCLSCLPQ